MLCRVCNIDPETPSHILCHCPTNMVKNRVRHDLIVSRLANSIRFGNARRDQQVAGLDDTCRPDILIENGNEVTVIDVTVPFENSSDALQAAEDRKIQKYAHIAQHFMRMGKNCRVFGFVVGSLGAWHPHNEKALDRIQISPRYRKLFRKLCCSDAICGSADIYLSHMNVLN